MIEYEERFAGKLPPEFFPLPLNGTYRKGGKPPFVALRALAKARAFLDGLPYVEHRFPRNSKSALTRAALAALNIELRRCDRDRNPLKNEERDEQAVLRRVAKLRRVMSQIETWDIAEMVVDDYLSTYQMMRANIKNGWDTYDRDFEPDKFVGFTNLQHVISVFRAHRDSFMAPVSLEIG